MSISKGNVLKFGAALAMASIPLHSMAFGPSFPVVTDTRYIKTCGECHMVYQPQLLPARSWKKLMEPTQLASHFGESLDLDAPTRDGIMNYLTTNSAETSNNPRAKEILASIKPGDTPLRISKTPFIDGWHISLYQPDWEGYTLPERPSSCNICHYRADLGDYNEKNFGVRDRRFTIRKDAIGWWE